jgi:RimJ/RimL family protein N-acetyltransferase
MDAGASLEAMWPLFGLRIRTERLVLRLPTDDDLPALIELSKAGIHEPNEMPFGIAWTTDPSPTLERRSLQHHWGGRSAWTPEDWNLHLSTELDGVPIGAQTISATRFAVFRTVSTGSWLGQAYQGRGFGTEMRGAVLALAFDALGAEVAESEAFLDNLASAGVSRSLGYEDNGRGALAPQGVSRETQRYRMTAAGWRARPRPPVTIEGVDACRELFGI